MFKSNCTPETLRKYCPIKKALFFPSEHNDIEVGGTRRKKTLKLKEKNWKKQQKNKTETRLYKLKDHNPYTRKSWPKICSKLERGKFSIQSLIH